MIRTIDIANFGCFKAFEWDKSVRLNQKPDQFNSLNVIYGRNYSGKTTLSRILRSFETKQLPEKYNQPQFSIGTDAGRLTQDDIETGAPDLRVYNSDFVNEHLSFLRDAGGDIRAFAVLGEQSKRIEAEIEEKQKQLGDTDSATGLRAEHSRNGEFLSKRTQEVIAEENSLKQKLTDFASQKIKLNPIYECPLYVITTLKKDIDVVRQDGFKPIDDKEVDDSKRLLNEEERPKINRMSEFQAKFPAIVRRVNELLKKKIEPSEAIQELMYDSALQNWAQNGMIHHRDKRTHCGFCHQPLPDNLWQRLDAHFNQESKNLKSALDKAVNDVESEIEAATGIQLPEREQFYSSDRLAVESHIQEFHRFQECYRSELRALIQQLDARKQDIFNERDALEVKDYSESLNQAIGAINQLITENTEKTQSLSERQKQAREQLRLRAVSDFVVNINLSEIEEKIKVLEAEKTALEKQADTLQKKINEVQQAIESLQIQLQDERQGAEKVNKYLNHYFGHQELHLQAVEQGASHSPDNQVSYKFQVMRGDSPAFNLSEGECSLVAFCYFIARLSDVQSQGRELIIYIDDPISSLDTNHIFFVFSLIESAIARPKNDQSNTTTFRYGQLFISTHNLEFLKYLNRLTKPMGGESRYFVVSSNGNSSFIRRMPRYMKQYQTEFFYLFDQIYQCRKAQPDIDDLGAFYSFGNNLRRFLEAYLVYRYPHIENQENRLEKFLDDDSQAAVLVNRLYNEHSHLEGNPDRGLQLFNNSEIPQVASYVLERMRNTDPDQFDSLLKCIGAPSGGSGDLP